MESAIDQKYLAQFRTVFQTKYHSLDVYLIGLADVQRARWSVDGMNVALLDADQRLPDPAAILFDGKRSQAVVLVIEFARLLRSSKLFGAWLREVSKACAAREVDLCVAQWSDHPLAGAALLQAFSGYDDSMNRRAAEIAEGLAAAQTVEIRNPRGTELWLQLADRRVLREDNFSLYCDRETQFPGGEVFVAPREYTASGMLVVPLVQLGIRQPGEAQIRLRAGRIATVEVPGDLDTSRKVERLLGLGEALCEFAVGINRGVPAFNLNVPWAEKALGTVHIGFGDNTHFGGLHVSDDHYDIVVSEPTVLLDGCAWDFLGGKRL